MLSDIEIIQGDTSNPIFTVEVGVELIEELWFSSKRLGIKQKLTKINDTQYMANFTTELTCECKVCTTTYDITAKLKESQRYTPVHNGKIIILKKENDIDGY